jgi:hypothetical protein
VIATVTDISLTTNRKVSFVFCSNLNLTGQNEDVEPPPKMSWHFTAQKAASAILINQQETGRIWRHALIR